MTVIKRFVPGSFGGGGGGAGWAPVWICLVALSGLGCSDTEEPASAGSGLPARRVVTADFLEQSISVLDFDEVIAGDAELSTLNVKRIELGEYAPGPLQLELTPNGDQALVAVGPGFYHSLGSLFGFPSVDGDGALLLVDLPSGNSTALTTQHTPMGVAVSPDGRFGYSANFGRKGAGGSTLSRVDLSTASTLEEVDVGGSPEQVRLHPSGVGLLNTASEGGVRRFDPADVAGSLSEVVATSADPSDIAFLNQDLAVVVDSRAAAGYSVLDLSSGLQVVEQVTLKAGIPYGICAIPGTTEVLIGIATGTPTLLLRIDVGSIPSAEVARYELGNTSSTFVINVSCSPDGEYALVPIPIENRLAVIQLASGDVHHISGWTNAAPTYASIGFGSP